MLLTGYYLLTMLARHPHEWNATRSPWLGWQFPLITIVTTIFDEPSCTIGSSRKLSIYLGRVSAIYDWPECWTNVGSITRRLMNFYSPQRNYYKSKNRCFSAIYCLSSRCAKHPVLERYSRQPPEVSALYRSITRRWWLHLQSKQSTAPRRISDHSRGPGGTVGMSESVMDLQEHRSCHSRCAPIARSSSSAGRIARSRCLHGNTCRLSPRPGRSNARRSAGC